MGNREAKFRKVFEEIDMNGDHKVSFFELAAFIISPKAVHELEEFTKALFINNVFSIVEWSRGREGCPQEIIYKVYIMLLSKDLKGKVNPNDSFSS